MAIIQLTRGLTAVIDDADLPLVVGFRWQASAVRYRGSIIGYYAISGRSRSKILMHRLIIGAKFGEQVDHKDRDKLNNRRDNLRLATSAQNSVNRQTVNGISGFRGVTFDKRKRLKPWRSQVMINGVRKSLGCFATAIDAAVAWDQKVRMVYGEFAILNFP